MLHVEFQGEIRSGQNCASGDLPVPRAYDALAKPRRTPSLPRTSSGGSSHSRDRVTGFVRGIVVDLGCAPLRIAVVPRQLRSQD
jgi:hypothetical protein